MGRYLAGPDQPGSLAREESTCVSSCVRVSRHTEGVAPTSSKAYAIRQRWPTVDAFPPTVYILETATPRESPLQNPDRSVTGLATLL